MFPCISGHGRVLKYSSLVLLTLQNAALILVMRYVSTRKGDMFMFTTAVVMSEILKFVSCLFILLIQVSHSLPFRYIHGEFNQNFWNGNYSCLKKFWNLANLASRVPYIARYRVSWTQVHVGLHLEATSGVA